MSRLILYPESANQTVYTPAVTAEDAGNYTCLLRNDSVVHSHTIKLTVFGKSNSAIIIRRRSQSLKQLLGYRSYCIRMIYGHAQVVAQRGRPFTETARDPIYTGGWLVLTNILENREII